MEVLEIEGKQYVKVSQAARKVGYTSDYVGQLCRSGAIDAHLVGRSWYVDAEQLAAHRVNKKRYARIKAREQVRKAIEENKNSSENTQGLNYLRYASHPAPVSYVADDRELIPDVQKPQERDGAHIVDEKTPENEKKWHTPRQQPETEAPWGGDGHIPTQVQSRIPLNVQKGHPISRTMQRSIKGPFQTNSSYSSKTNVTEGATALRKRSYAGHPYNKKRTLWFVAIVVCTLGLSLSVIFVEQKWTFQQGTPTGNPPSVTVGLVFDVTPLADLFEQLSEITKHYIGVSATPSQNASQNTA